MISSQALFLVSTFVLVFLNVTGEEISSSSLLPTSVSMTSDLSVGPTPSSTISAAPLVPEADQLQKDAPATENSGPTRPPTVTAGDVTNLPPLVHLTTTPAVTALTEKPLNKAASQTDPKEKNFAASIASCLASLSFTLLVILL